MKGEKDALLTLTHRKERDEKRIPDGRRFTVAHCGMGTPEKTHTQKTHTHGKHTHREEGGGAEIMKDTTGPCWSVTVKHRDKILQGLLPADESLKHNEEQPKATG